MTEGLVTRIGRWIDHRWESKATESQMKELSHIMNTRCDNVELSIARIDLKLNERIDLLRTPEGVEKEVADLKTRLEKIELYSGMTRKVDPTKPPMVKSAFQI